MLYIVLFPAWVWTFLLMAGWTTLAYRALVQVPFRHPLLQTLLAVLLVQVIAASAGAFATSHYAIGRVACLTGIFGIWISLGLTLTEAVAFVYLSKHWPRDKEDIRHRFRSSLILWLLLKLVAFLAHMRSALLCTV